MSLFYCSGALLQCYETSEEENHIWLGKCKVHDKTIMSVLHT